MNFLVFERVVEIEFSSTPDAATPSNVQPEKFALVVAGRTVEIDYSSPAN